MPHNLQDWVRNTAEAPLYAILANTNGAQGIKAYYREDGSRTPFGLYANTQYANWFEVMPVLVQINEGSPSCAGSPKLLCATGAGWRVRRCRKLLWRNILPVFSDYWVTCWGTMPPPVGRKSSSRKAMCGLSMTSLVT